MERLPDSTANQRSPSICKVRIGNRRRFGIPGSGSHCICLQWGLFDSDFLYLNIPSLKFIKPRSIVLIYRRNVRGARYVFIPGSMLNVWKGRCPVLFFFLGQWQVSSLLKEEIKQLLLKLSTILILFYIVGMDLTWNPSVAVKVSYLLSLSLIILISLFYCCTIRPYFYSSSVAWAAGHDWISLDSPTIKNYLVGFEIRLGQKKKIHISGRERMTCKG